MSPRAYLSSEKVQDSLSVPPGTRFDAKGVAIDEAQRSEEVSGRSETRAKSFDVFAERSSERGAQSSRERTSLQEKLTQLQRDLQEDQSAIAYNKMQLESLQRSINPSNRYDLGMQILGFEKDNLMRMQRAAGFSRQISEIRNSLESSSTQSAAA